MPQSLKERILKSPTGQQMLEWVSPIYEDSYVGLWLFEAIGREYDKLWEITNTFPQQLFPESATWTIELWERRYGISPTKDQTLAERRLAIQRMRSLHAPLNPYKFERIAEQITGNPARAEDHVGPYTFGVWFTTTDYHKYEEVRKEFKRLKPSHMSMDLTDILQPDNHSAIHAATAQSGMHMRATATMAST